MSTRHELQACRNQGCMMCWRSKRLTALPNRRVYRVASCEKAENRGGQLCVLHCWLRGSVATPLVCRPAATESIEASFEARVTPQGHYVIGVDWKRNEHMPVSGGAGCVGAARGTAS